MVILSSSPLLQFKSLSLANPFLHGAAVRTANPTLRPSSSGQQSLEIKAMRSLQGKVVCSTNDKTVAVEVVRLAPHPKYKRRVKKKKTYQAHDPLNQFKVGDFVRLEKHRPISKTKTFWAFPFGRKTNVEAQAEAEVDAPQELSIPLESTS